MHEHIICLVFFNVYSNIVFQTEIFLHYLIEQAVMIFAITVFRNLMQTYNHIFVQFITQIYHTKRIKSKMKTIIFLMPWK